MLLIAQGIKIKIPKILHCLYDPIASIKEGGLSIGETEHSDHYNNSVLKPSARF
jgi:hypothetical protein